MPSDPPRSFDPTSHLTEHRGRKYLEVKWRLLWLRAEHPDAEIETEEIASGEDWVKFRAKVSVVGHGSATGHAYEARSEASVGFYEKAETKALGRALAALGYGAQFASEFDEDTAPLPQPTETPIEFPRPGPRPVRESLAERKEPLVTRARNATTWSDFWSAVREYKTLNPGFDEAAVVGREPAKRMTADEALRRFRSAVSEEQ
ncbi:MAG: hypothetical protein M3P51_04650 [Chloroflexota bacterium]|nr:hypothetical protein [Chloroflexota bacterium]